MNARCGYWPMFVVSVCAVVLLTAAPLSAQETALRELTLLHTSSFYNHVEEFTPFGQPLQGGAARLTTAVREARESHPNTLLLSSGRDVMGTPLFAQYGGIVSAEVFSRMGYDAALVTDVDLGAGGSIDGFQVYNAVVSYPLISTNLDLSNLPDLNVLPSIVLETNGIQVGVFGLSNEGGGLLTNLGESIGVIDVEEVIPETLAFFKDLGVDVVVALSALSPSRDAEIARAYGGPEGIDVIVGNDSSVILGDEAQFEGLGMNRIGPYPLVFNEETAPTLVVYGGKFGSFLGELHLAFDENGVLQSWDGGLRFLDESVAPDLEMQAYVEELVAGVQLDEIIIGEATTDLPGVFRDYPWIENPLQNIYADAFLDAGQPFGAEIALVNAGAAWDTIAAGDISFADLARAQPFFNWLIVSEITGEQLLAMLEHGVEKFGAQSSSESGRFLHVAGMTYSFDPSLEPGQRVVEALVNGEPVSEDKTYTVAINDFMANGGDGFAMLQEARTRFNTGLSITELLQQYIEAHSPLEVPEMGRITILTQ